MPAGYLLDTSVVAELRKGERADPGVQGWFDRHADDALWLSVLVVGELRRGGELLRRRDERAGHALLAWIETVTVDYADRILPVTARVAARWAARDQMPVVDGVLAATAIEHDLVLVTRRATAVERTGVRAENPFSGDVEPVTSGNSGASGDSGERQEPTPRVETGGGDRPPGAAPRSDVRAPVVQRSAAPQRSRRPRPGTRGRRPA